jgi:hypothetical protein
MAGEELQEGRISYEDEPLPQGRGDRQSRNASDNARIRRHAPKVDEGATKLQINLEGSEPWKRAIEER